MNGKRLLLPLSLLLAATVSSLVHASCNPNIPPVKAENRYLVHDNGTVTDTVTGLLWMRCPEGRSTTTTACDTGSDATFVWQGAQDHVARVNAGEAGENLGYADWRLPSLKELKSLAEMTCHDPTINSEIFPATPANGLWSASVVEKSPEHAWLVNVLYYGTGYWALKQNAFAVRLVRTAP